MQTKTITLTYQEIIRRRQSLEQVRPKGLPDPLVKNISRTLSSVTGEHEALVHTFQALARKYAVHEGDEPVTCQRRVQQAEQEDVDPPGFTDLERRAGYVLEDEDALREAEQELLQEETEIEVYLCPRSKAETDDMTMAEFNRLEFLINYDN